MTSEVEERPKLITADYGWHGSLWVKKTFPALIPMTKIADSVRV